MLLWHDKACRAMKNEEEMWIRNQSNDTITKERQTQRAQNNNRTLEQLYCRQEIVQNVTDSSQNKTCKNKTQKDVCQPANVLKRG